jgi:hypothetical protein
MEKEDGEGDVKIDIEDEQPQTSEQLYKKAETNNSSLFELENNDINGEENKNDNNNLFTVKTSGHDQINQFGFKVDPEKLSVLG